MSVRLTNSCMCLLLRCCFSWQPVESMVHSIWKWRNHYSATLAPPYFSQCHTTRLQAEASHTLFTVCDPSDQNIHCPYQELWHHRLIWVGAGQRPMGLSLDFFFLITYILIDWTELIVWFIFVDNFIEHLTRSARTAQKTQWSFGLRVVWNWSHITWMIHFSWRRQLFVCALLTLTH